MTQFLTDLFTLGDLSLIDFLKAIGAYQRVITVLVLLALIVSLLLCYFGYRMLRFWMAALGFLCGFSLGAALLGAVLPDRQWYYYAGAAMIGLVLAFLAYKIYLVGVFIVCGAVAGITVYSFVTQYALPQILPQLIAILSFILFGVLAVRFNKTVIILATSAAGAYYATRALVSLVDSLAASPTYQMITIAALAGSGILLQFLMSHGKK